LLSFLWEPLNWLALLLFVGVVLLFLKRERARMWGRRMVAIACWLAALLSWSGLPETMIAAMETQYEVPNDLKGYHGMVVLGGAIASPRIRDTAVPPLGCAAERVAEPVLLMQRHPNLKLLFTGGDARIASVAQPESNDARQYFEHMGVEMSRTLFESNSRNTYENAVMSARLAGVDKTQRWLLVTSAWHMPRALAAFKKAGWNATAYPVDFYSSAEVGLNRWSLADGIEAWRLLLRERLAMLVYRALDRV
jgi:uncharacterized SAM-binding protein YcdF (DUF218 family)